MPAVIRRARALGGSLQALAAVAALAALAGGATTGCAKKASQRQCDQLLDRFAELVVKEQLADAGAAEIAKERERERGEAQADPTFTNCTSEVQVSEADCAMKASTSEGMIKCLE
jgi:hypothetical protein